VGTWPAHFASWPSPETNMRALLITLPLALGAAGIVACGQVAESTQDPNAELATFKVTGMT